MTVLTDSGHQLLDRLAAAGKATRLTLSELQVAKSLEAHGLIFLIGYRIKLPVPSARLLVGHLVLKRAALVEVGFLGERRVLSALREINAGKRPKPQLLKDRSGVRPMTITRAVILATAALLLASHGTLSAAEAPQHNKARQHQHRRQAAKQVSTPTKGAVQYGNNTQDNSHGGVYGENSFKGE